MLMEKRMQMILMWMMDQEDIITSEQLAQYTGVTSRTIKEDIKKINQIIGAYGARIYAKRGCGYQIQIFDTDLYQSFLDQIRKNDGNANRIPQSRMQRVNYIIMKLLIVDYYIKIDDFAEELYIDRSTFSSCLKEVKIILQKYHLCIEHVSGRGIIIRGSEINLRICIAEYFFHNSLTTSFLSEDNMMFADLERQNEIKAIKDILNEVLNAYDIQISSYSFENMIIHIIVALRRWVLYNYAKVDDAQYSFLNNSCYLKAGEALVQALEKEYSIMLPHDEAVYFAIHFQTKHIATNASAKEEDTRYDAFFTDLFDEIKRIYGISFHQDQDLIRLLKMHLPAMLSRLRLSFTLRNLTLYEYFRKYLFAYKITDIAVKNIHDTFHLDMEINEFGFLVLYFNWALQRLHKHYRMKMLLVCGNGRPESIVWINEISERYKRIVECVDLVDLKDLAEKKPEEYDVLVTTMHTRVHVDLPVLSLSLQQLEELKRLDGELLHLYYKKMDVLSLFHPDMLVFGIDGNTKYAVLEKIAASLSAQERKEWETIQEGEKILSSEIGHYLAIFHSCAIHQPILFRMYVLKRSIIWDKQFVQVMIWIGANPQEQERCWLLLELLSKWAADITSVSRFLQIQNYEAFMEGIKKAMDSLI